MKISLVAILALCLAAFSPGNAEPLRQRSQLDDDWKFILGDPANAQAPDFDDAPWRAVTLPHDWSIEGKNDPKAPMGGCGGFFPAGIGWYRLHLKAPAAWAAKRVSLEFDGVYMNADVYLNGQKLVNHPYGFTPFFADLTPALRPAAPNILAVRVNNSDQRNCRWYTGSGIYRHVSLHVTEPLHVAPRGVFATTPKANAQSATVTVKTTVSNETGAAQTATVETTILGPDDKPLGKATSPCAAAAGSGEITQSFELKTPPLWSPENPQQSVIVTQILVGGKAVDEVRTPFGIRTLAWSVDKGLTINGQTVKLNGGCIHDDNGVLGACAFDRAEERKIQLLKAAGFNAIRTAHNPPSTALLDVCDRLGMLVMDEAFDNWAFNKGGKHDYSVLFKTWWERDLDAMMLRDRNHPSVVMWSIGNEIPGVFEAMGEEYGPKLANHIRALDPTRPVTNGIVAWPGKNKEAEQKAAEINWNSLDIAGSNYTLGSHIKQHDKYPNRILVSTESMPPIGLPEEVTTLPYVVGDFVWSAQDYLGEVGVGRWFYQGDPTEPLCPPRADRPNEERRPVQHGVNELFPWRGAACGDIDLIGYTRPAGHWRNIAWNAGEKLFMAVRQPEDDKKIVVVPWGWFPVWESWTWPGREGKPMEVEVYSRYEKVNLYLNGKPVEAVPHNPKESFQDKFKTHFKLTYEPGTLRAAGVKDGKEVESCQLATVGEPASIRLVADRAKLQADGQDLAFVRVEVVDKAGNLQPNADHEIAFTLDGPGVIAGLGNANLKSTEPYQGSTCHVDHGRALVVVRTGKIAGTLVLKAKAPGLAPAQAALTSSAR